MWLILIDSDWGYIVVKMPQNKLWKTVAYKLFFRTRWINSSCKYFSDLLQVTFKQPTKLRLEMLENL